MDAVKIRSAAGFPRQLDIRRFFNPEFHMKNFEVKLRREVARDGNVLRKSRVRNPLHPTYGGYMIVDPSTNIPLAGGDGFGFSLSLDDVEAWLNS